MTLAIPERYANLASKMLFTEQQILSRIQEVAKEIHAYYGKLVSVDKPLVLVVVLNGAFIFAADLARALSDLGVPLRLDFICVSSYGGTTASSGEVRMILDVRKAIRDYHVLMVEDIVDTAQTLNFLLKLLSTRKPASIKMVTLLDKKEARKIPLEVEFCCFDCPKEFVVGYGLDYGKHESYRELRDIIVLKEEIYASKL